MIGKICLGKHSTQANSRLWKKKTPNEDILKFENISTETYTYRKYRLVLGIFKSHYRTLIIFQKLKNKT